MEQRLRRQHAVDQGREGDGGNDLGQEAVEEAAALVGEEVERIEDGLEQPDGDVTGLERAADFVDDAFGPRGPHHGAAEQGIGHHLLQRDAIDHRRANAGIDGQPDGDAGKDLHQLAEDIGPDLVAIGELGLERAASEGGIGAHEASAAALRRW
jgi:hypothetical protein